MKLGDVFFVFALWVWLTVAVGPIWLGVSVFLGAMFFNTIDYLIRRALR